MPTPRRRIIGRRAQTVRLALASCALAAAVVVPIVPPHAGAAPGDLLDGSLTLYEDNATPRAIWSDRSTMWVSDLSGALYAYDLATGERSSGSDITALNAAGNLNATGMWSDHRTIWVVDDSDYRVYAYDLATGKRLRSAEISSLDRAGNNHPKGLWSDGRTMWVVDWYDDKVYAYDLRSGNRQRDRDVGPLARNHDRASGLWSDGVTMWIADDRDAKVYAYDLATGKRRSGQDFNRLRAAGNTSPKGVWSDGSTMWVVDNLDDKIYPYAMSVNTVLSSLELDGIEIGFSPGRLAYEAVVPTTTTVTTVVAEAVSDAAEVTFTPAADADPDTDGHQVSLASGDNTITVTVDNAGKTRDYTARIFRSDAEAEALSDSTDLDALEISGGDIGPFSNLVRYYAASVAPEVDEITVDATPADSYATVTVTLADIPADADANTPGHQVSLSTGVNNIDVNVRSSDGTARRKYRIAVNRSSAEPFGWHAAKDLDVQWTDSDPDITGVWSDGSTMWVVDWSEDKLYAYDLGSGARRRDRDLPGLGAAGNGLAVGVWSDGVTVWVADLLEAKLFAYDLATGERSPASDVDTLDAARNHAPRGVWSDGVTVWVTDSKDDKVYAYDLDSGARRRGRDLTGLRSAGNTSPTGLWSDGVTMWVVDDDDVKIHAYDLAGGERRSELDFDTLSDAGNDSPTGLWSDGVTMWVADRYDDKVYAYNMAPSTALASLELDSADIGFRLGRLAYDIGVESDTDSVTVSAVPVFADSAVVTISPADADADAEGHQVDLAEGTTMIGVSVADGADTRLYTVAVNRTMATAVSDDPTLDGLTLDGIAFDHFDGAVTSYTLAAPADVAVTTVTATPADEHAVVSISPVDADAVAEGHQVDLDAVVNIITVRVRSSDGTASETYSLVVNRASADVFGWDSTKDLSLGWPPDIDDAEGLWSDGTTVWVSRRSHGSVEAFDLATGERLPERDITGLGNTGNSRPGGIWSDGTTMWVNDQWDAKVYAYDLATGERRPGREFGLHASNANPSDLWSDGTTVWIADIYDSHLYAYDLETGERTRDREVGSSVMRPASNRYPDGLWSDGVTMWVADFDDEKIYAYDLAAGERDASLEFNTLSAVGNRWPRGIWSDGATMWVVDVEDNKLYGYNMPPSAALSSFSLDGADLAFWVGRSSYAARVPVGTDSVTVTAAAAFPDSAAVTIAPADADDVAGGHQVALAAGPNTITVSVVNGADSRTYTAVVTRTDAPTLSDDATLSGLDLGGIDIGAFAADVHSYSAEAASGDESVTVTATPADAYADVTITPVDADDLAEGHQVALAVGLNTITVSVTSSDGTARSAYTVAVSRASEVEFGWSVLPDFKTLASGNGSPRAMWSDGTTMWVTDLRGTLFAYDLSTMERKPADDITSLRAAGNRHANGLWSDGSTIWVSDGRDDKIYAYDLASGERQPGNDFDTLDGAGNENSKGLWSDGTTMWVSDWLDDKIYAYDLASGSRTSGSDIAGLIGAGNGRSAGLWSDGITLWVVDDDDAKIYAYDLAGGERRSELDFDTLSDAGNDSPKGLWSNGSIMWVVDNDDDRIYAYNMPTTVALAGLALEGIDFGVFHPSITRYEAWVPNSTSATTLTVSAVDAAAQLTVAPVDADGNAAGHQIDLAEGDNIVTVTVTSGDNSREYTVVVVRTQATTLTDDATLSVLELSDVDFGGLSAGSRSYSADVLNDVTVTTVTATPNDEHATVLVSPADADTGTEGHQVDLAEGTNIVRVSVQSSDGNVRTVYKVTVNRASQEAFAWGVLSDFKELAPANATVRAVWSDGATLWATDLSARLFAYDLATMAREQVRDIASLGAAGNRNGNGMWSDGTIVWVSDDADDRVYAYDLRTGDREPSRDIASLGRAGNGAAKGLWSDGTTMWVSDHADDRIYAYDLLTGVHETSRDIVHLDDVGNGRAAGLWSDGVTLWVVDDEDAKIYAYDLTTGEHRPDLEFDTLADVGNRSPKGLWSDGVTMWVADNDDDKLYGYNMPPSAALASLELDGVGIGTFVPSRYRYTARVPNTVSSTTVIAAAADPAAVVDVTPADADDVADGHQVALGDGDTTIEVTVTDSTGTRTYTVVVTKVDAATLSDDASLSGVSLGGLELADFDPARTDYSVDAAHAIAVTTVTATAAGAHAVVSVHPADSDAITDNGHQVSLQVGVNVVRIAVESSSGNTRRHYTITINRARS